MGRAKLYWYKRNPQHWLNGTRELSLEERGAYGDILEFLYLHDRRIPDEPRFIASFLGITPRKWSAIRSVLLDLGKLEKVGEYLTNRRFELERAESAKEREEHSQRSRRGGKARAEQAARDRQGRFDGFDEENGSFPPANSSRHLDDDRQKRTSQEKTQQNQGQISSQCLDDLDDSFLRKDDVSRDFREDFGEFSRDFRVSSDSKNGSFPPASSSHARVARAGVRVQNIDKQPNHSMSEGGSGGKRGTRLPDDFDIHDLTENTARLVADWPDGKLQFEFDRMKDWAAAKGETSKDWKASWRNWLRKANDDYRREQRRAGPGRKGWAAVAARAAGAG